MVLVFVFIFACCVCCVAEMHPLDGVKVAKAYALDVGAKFICRTEIDFPLAN